MKKLAIMLLCIFASVSVVSAEEESVNGIIDATYTASNTFEITWGISMPLKVILNQDNLVNGVGDTSDSAYDKGKNVSFSVFDLDKGTTSHTGHERIEIKYKNAPVDGNIDLLDREGNGITFGFLKKNPDGTNAYLTKDNNRLNTIVNNNSENSTSIKAVVTQTQGEISTDVRYKTNISFMFSCVR